MILKYETSLDVFCSSFYPKHDNTAFPPNDNKITVCVLYDITTIFRLCLSIYKHLNNKQLWAWSGIVDNLLENFLTPLLRHPSRVIITFSILQLALLANRLFHGWTYRMAYPANIYSNCKYLAWLWPLLLVDSLSLQLFFRLIHKSYFCYGYRITINKKLLQ